jgi:hypothetical protein
MNSKIAFIFAAVFVAGFAVGYGLSVVIPKSVQIPQPLTVDQMFKNAIRDAMVVEEWKICNNLTAIVNTNPSLMWREEGENRTVLVVVWTKYPSSYPFGGVVNTTWGETWVTVAPELKNFFKDNSVPAGNITVRAEQLLGLPRNNGNTHFVELWVRPQDLFRPSPDCEINDTVTQLTFPENADSAYKKWFNDNIIHSYFSKQYPWTRLGYTYDWGDPHGSFGLTEYVIRQNSTVIVESLTSTVEYLHIND